jgi:hypothetical protein
MTLAITLDLSLPVEDHLVWDGWAEATGADVGWPNVAVRALDRHADARGWRCILDDDELGMYVERLREVVKQPLVGSYAAAADTLLVFLEICAKARTAQRKRRKLLQTR